MKDFTSVLRRAGEIIDGVALSADQLKNCDGVDVLIKSAATGEVVPGAEAKAVWEDGLKILLVKAQIPEEVDLTGVVAELLVLTKEAEILKETAAAVGKEIVEAHEKKVKDIDDSIEHETVEIWYDCRQWMRFVKTRVKDDRPASDVGGDGYMYMYAGMSCVEEGVATFMVEETYEQAKRASKAGRSFAKVKNPLSKSSLFAENKFIGLMQKVFDAEPEAQGHRVLLPPMFLEEFEEISA